MNTNLETKEKLDPELEAILCLPSPIKETKFIDYVLTHHDFRTGPVFGGQNFEFYKFDGSKMLIQ